MEAPENKPDVRSRKEEIEEISDEYRDAANS